MYYDLGDTIPLSVVIRDANNALADPSALVLTILLPDKTTTTPTPVKDSTGLYHYDYAPTVAGTFIARWAGTGPAVAYEQTFTVRGAYEQTLISLDDFKGHLNKTNTTDDEELRETLAVASAMIVDRIGPVLPTTRIEVLRGGSETVVVKDRVVSVTTVTEFPRAQTVAEQSGLVASSGHYFYKDGPDGQTLVRRLGYLPYPWAPIVKVEYLAGLGGEVPPAIRRATRTVAKHLWSTQRGAVGVPRADGAVDWQPGQGFAMPRAALELLDRYMGAVS
jgi:hypothetical protein